MNLNQQRAAQISKAYEPSNKSIREVIEDNFKKGAIDQATFESACNQLELIEKAGKGEGSKGGHVIGHTKSGKPIYDSADHSAHKKFSMEDHVDAKIIHGDKSKEYERKHQEGAAGYISFTDGHTMSRGRALAAHHNVQAQKHSAMADKKMQFSDTEHKILSDQGEFKMKHHSEMQKHHAAMFEHATKEQAKHKPGSTAHSALQAESERHLAESQRHKSEKERHYNAYKEHMMKHHGMDVDRANDLADA